MVNDLRYAVRTLAKSPGFTAVAALTLGLGIALTTAAISVVKAVVLDPLPYPNADRLVQVWGGDRGEASLPWRDQHSFSAPEYLDLREQAASFEELGAYDFQRFNLGGDRPESVDGVACTAGVLGALGVRPALGRWFTDAEAQAGANHIAILSHALWVRHFAADPEVVGRAVRLNGEAFSVIGVMPAGFDLLSPWKRSQAFDVWTPLVLDRSKAYGGLQVVGRLKLGVTHQRVKVELETIAARLAVAHPETFNPTIWHASLSSQNASPALYVSWLLAAGWLVLQLACNNVAAMLLARGLSRQSEMAVRAALGAGRRQIVRLMLAESLLLSLIAGAAGTLLAAGILHAFTGWLPPGLAPRAGIRIDGWTLVFSVGLAGLAALMSGLTPARVAAKGDLASALKEGGTNQAGSHASQRHLRRLVVTQIAFALVFVNAATFLSGSYRNLLKTHRALATDQVLTAELALLGPNYSKAEDRAAFWEQLVERIRTLPSVRQAAVTSKLPFEWHGGSGVLREGDAYDPRASRPFVQFPSVSPAYFAAVGTALLRGRVLADSDSRAGELHVVVNRSMAERLWPGQDPVGQRVRHDAASPGWSAVVVGVVEDVRQREFEPARPEMYMSFKSRPESDARLVVRCQCDSRSLAMAIRREVASLDTDLALGNVRSMKEVFEAKTQSMRFLTLMIDLFMVLALALVAIGVYGTLSFHVAQRSRDIGVRVAMGADRRAILLMVFRQAGRWVGTGAAIGLAVTLGVAEVLRAMLHAVSPLNTASLAAAVGVVVTASLLACWIPARRAARVDPMVALRCE